MDSISWLVAFVHRRSLGSLKCNRLRRFFVLVEANEASAWLVAQPHLAGLAAACRLQATAAQGILFLAHAMRGSSFLLSYSPVTTLYLVTLTPHPIV